MAQVNVKFDESDPFLKELEECAQLLGQAPTAIAKRILKENIAAFKAKAKRAAAVLNEPSTHHTPETPTSAPKARRSALSSTRRSPRSPAN
jgi:hypothetical protein